MAKVRTLECWSSLRNSMTLDEEQTQPFLSFLSRFLSLYLKQRRAGMDIQLSSQSFDNLLEHHPTEERLLFGHEDTRRLQQPFHCQVFDRFRGSVMARKRTCFWDRAEKQSFMI